MAHHPTHPWVQLKLPPLPQEPVGDTTAAGCLATGAPLGELGALWDEGLWGWRTPQKCFALGPAAPKLNGTLTQTG